MRITKLNGPNVSLAPVEAGDAMLWYRWLNDLAVTIPLGGEASDVLTLTAMEEDCEKAARRGDPIFTILHNETGLPIGRCLLFNLNRQDRTTNVGIFIGEREYWSQGLGTEAMALLLDYCFNLLNLHSVMLGAFRYNERAIASYRKLGFREIGRRREARWLGGRAYDCVLMDLLAREFRHSVLGDLLPGKPD